jgi:WD40 repeat protein/ribosomal protein L37AE/L43A
MYSIGNQGKMMRKLLGKQSSPESAHDTTASSVANITSSPLAPQYRPTASQDVIYAAGVPITCIDSSPDGRSAVLAGLYVLRTVGLDGLTVREGIDLRALLAAQPALRNNTPTSVADQLSIKAVKWGEPQGRQAIFTACTNGKIFEYDLGRAALTSLGDPVDCVQIREDSRQVNSLDINPHRNSWLLSGSQDGIVRCFDVRQPTHTRTGATFRSTQAFKCNADVHHVQWSPRDGFLFACGTEQGVVMKWDIRKPNAPLLRISAHEKTCTSIAWHPDGIHLASAGLDGKCNIWDMSKQDKRQKPKWTISTPAPAATLAWRPGQWSATAQGKRASQLAMSYDESSRGRYGISAVHIWDLARPTMPYKEIQRFDSSPSAILWHDQYLLWTAGQDGIFSQCDVSFAPKVIDRQAVSTMAFSSRGDVLMLLDERAPPPRPRPHLLHHDAVGIPSYSSSPTTPKFSVSRSDSEDDAVGSFLGPRRRGSRRRRPSTRSTPALSTTPPAAPGMDEVMSLEQTIKVTGIYRPQQAMAIGHAPAAASVEVYEYLAVNYLEAMYRELPPYPGCSPLPDRLANILEHYAKAAANVRKFRLAQTWRILAYAVNMLLHRRAQYHLECRMDRHNSSVKRKSEIKAKSWEKSMEALMEPGFDGEATPRKVTSMTSLDNALHPRSLLTEEMESTSNVPTPVARPVPDHHDPYHADDTRIGKKLTPIVEPESFTLPPAAHLPLSEPRRRLNSVPLSITSHDSDLTQASTEGYDFYDTEALSKAVDVPSTRPTPSQVLDYHEPGSPNLNCRSLSRHDSGDSYVHLFSISDESRRATGLESSPDSSTSGQARRHPSGRGNDGEYPSRIRGRRIEHSPGRDSAPSPRRLLQRTETDMTSYTDEHHIITQTTSDSFESQRYPSQQSADSIVGSPQLQASLAETVASPEDDKSPFIVETDYLCWPDDPPYPYPVHPSSSSPGTSSSPLQPYTLISRALEFEAKSSALNASAIVLLLKPLLPEDVIDPSQAAAILRQHHSRLMSMKLFVEAALLRKLCMKGWPGGALAFAWGEDYPAIFTTAQQGVQASFLCTRCHKPRDVDRTSSSTQSIWHCERCKAVMAPCAVCGYRDTAPNLASSAPGMRTEDPVLTTWWYCPGCGHGGHTSCLAAWHAAAEEPSTYAAALGDASGGESSDGCCPLDGCGHACLPGGRWRAESLATRTDEVSRVVREATRAAVAVAAANAKAVAGPVADHVMGVQAGDEQLHGPGEVHFGGYAHGGGAGVAAAAAAAAARHAVRSDGNDVPQSKAVETVRETLSSAVSASASRGPPGASILSSSPGRAGSGIGPERERRKSVKFVATEDRR